MSLVDEREYWVPEHVREYLRGLGFHLPLEAMEGHIRTWHEWMSATGDFYDYKDTDGFGRVYEVRRRSIHPAMWVCQEWGSLLLNDRTQVVCDDQACTDWLAEFLHRAGFMPQAQNTIVRAFGMGTGAWALWVDADARKVRIRHYDSRMVTPFRNICAYSERVFCAKVGPRGQYRMKDFFYALSIVLPEKDVCRYAQKIRYYITVVDDESFLGKVLAGMNMIYEEIDELASSEE